MGIKQINMEYEVGKRYRYVGDKDINKSKVYVYLNSFNIWMDRYEHVFYEEKEKIVVSTTKEDDFMPTDDMVIKRMVKHEL